MFIIANIKSESPAAVSFLRKQNSFDTIDELNATVQDVADTFTVDVYADVREVWTDPEEGEEYTTTIRQMVQWYPHYLPGEEWED